MLNTLNGYKTYVLAILGLVYAISGFFTGHIDANTAMELILGSGGLATLRHGISTDTGSSN